jgi:hypothetical protein
LFEEINRTEFNTQKIDKSYRKGKKVTVSVL